MDFYIYENWQAGPHKAVIHFGECGYCNNGVGRAGGYDPKHALWHGPYSNLQAARGFQRSLNVAVRSECRCVSRVG